MSERLRADEKSIARLILRAEIPERTFVRRLTMGAGSMGGGTGEPIMAFISPNRTMTSACRAVTCPVDRGVEELSEVERLVRRKYIAY